MLCSHSLSHALLLHQLLHIFSLCILQHGLVALFLRDKRLVLAFSLLFRLLGLQSSFLLLGFLGFALVDLGLGFCLRLGNGLFEADVLGVLLVEVGFVVFGTSELILSRTTERMPSMDCLLLPSRFQIWMRFELKREA